MGRIMDILQFSFLLILINSAAAFAPPGAKDISNYGSEFQHAVIDQKEWLDISRAIQDIPLNIDSVLEGIENEDCRAHVTQWALRLIKSENVDNWALHMLDAWGKFPSGIFSGHVNSWGDFDECVDIKVRDLQITGNNSNIQDNFEGMYCNTYLIPATIIGNLSTNEIGLMKTQDSMSPEELIEILMAGIPTPPSLGTCFPSTCGDEASRIMLGNILKNTSLIPLFNRCQVGDKPPLKAAEISVITMLSILAAICFLATLVDMYGVETPHGLGIQSLLCFSLYTNIRKLVNTNSAGDDMGCLNGIRFLSTALVVLRHTWSASGIVPFFNMVDAKTTWKDWTMMTISNMSFAVDAFFVISGLLVSFGILKQLSRSREKINIPMLYVHRYFRIAPTLAVTIAFVATIVPYLGRGPFWNMIESDVEACKTEWWKNMLFINSWFSPMDVCMSYTWYLSNDMMFYLLSPPLLLLIYHREIFGLIFLAVLTFLSCLCPFLIVYINKAAPTTGIWEEDFSQVYFNDVYMRPYTRAQTFLVGVWLGYIFYKTKDTKKPLPRPLVFLCWGLSTAICLSALYGITHWFEPGYPIPRFGSAFYAGFSRFGWGIGIAWVIFACVKGHGWIINDFLSWSGFIPLGRLGLSVYVVSYRLQMIFHFSATQPLVYSSYRMTQLFFSHMVTSYLVAFVLSMTVEAPFMRLEKLLLGNVGKPTGKVEAKPKTHANNDNGNIITGQEDPSDKQV